MGGLDSSGNNDTDTTTGSKGSRQDRHHVGSLGLGQSEIRVDNKILKESKGVEFNSGVKTEEKRTQENDFVKILLRCLQRNQIRCLFILFHGMSSRDNDLSLRSRSQ